MFLGARSVFRKSIVTEALRFRAEERRRAVRKSFLSVGKTARWAWPKTEIRPAELKRAQELSRGGGPAQRLSGPRTPLRLESPCARNRSGLPRTGSDHSGHWGVRMNPGMDLGEYELGGLLE